MCPFEVTHLDVLMILNIPVRVYPPWFVPQRLSYYPQPVMALDVLFAVCVVCLRVHLTIRTLTQQALSAQIEMQ